MTFYVKMTWQGKPAYSQYDGMTQDAIVKCLAGIDVFDPVFVTEDEFRTNSVKRA